eukprot:jgi/Tetstr1/442221/TSEL_003177.t1
MRYHAGDDITTTVSCLGDRYVAKWKKSNPEGDPAAVSLRGTVIGTNVGWVTVAFPDAHPPLSVPARLRPTALTLTGDRTSPNPVEGKAGSSTLAPRHEVANKRTLMEAAMSDPADAGEDDPPETAYGPPPDPPKTAWTHDVDAIGYFHAFFPMRDMEDAIALMNERAAAGEQYFPTPFATAEFHVFLGVNFAMCKYQTLSARDMFSVLAVKGGKARYPKEELLEATEEVRFSTCFRTTTFPVKKPGDHAGVPPLEVPLLAGAWQDKQCMLVVATCTDHEAADEDIRIRSKYEGGKIVKHRYPISQPNCHAFYRHHFNAIDIMNKLFVGPNSVSTVWQTREHMKKFFMCTLAVCETNAYNAYRQFTKRTDMTRAEWKHHLAEELIQYGTARMKKRPASDPSDGSPITPGAAYRRRTQIRSVCNICMEPVCNTTVPRKCFAVHFVRHLKALGWTAPK